MFVSYLFMEIKAVMCVLVKTQGSGANLLRFKPCPHSLCDLCELNKLQKFTRTPASSPVTTIDYYHSRSTSLMGLLGSM